MAKATASVPSGRLVPPLEPSRGDRAPSGIVLAVDARGLRKSGIGRYLREVLLHLFRDDRFAQVRLLGQPEHLAEFCTSAGATVQVVVIPYRYGFYSPRAQLAWMGGVGRRALTGADVAFYPHYDVPYWGGQTPSLVTVHDLIHFRLPQYFPGWRRIIADAMLRRAVSQAARVAVDSTHTAHDLAELVGASSGKTRVIPLGVSASFRARPDKVENRLPEFLERPYLLCVGNRKPHKNHIGAVEVLARVRRRVPEMKLVFAGPVYRGWGEVLERAAVLGVEEAIIDLAEVSDATLGALYRGCLALLFLSYYEGFGLPVLEAMASGAPVIASDRTAIPEVVGTAGILVDPDDHAAASAAVLRLLDDRALAEDLVRRGMERVRRYSWESTARCTADLLAELAGSGSSASALAVG